MPPERWQQIDRLFQAALERPPNQRDSFVRQACSGDETLEHEVRSLLASKEEAGSFLERGVLAPATTISHYRIIETLGRGGMGVVYKAEDTRLQRFVAIKFLAAEFARHPDALSRFQREAQAVSSLNHPHICTLHDIGQQDGTHFLVLEFVEGETLTDRLKKGPLPLELALRYAIEIAQALDQAHRRGVVHRDLKPGNIMITKSGTKLLDFGLARVGAAQRRANDDATATLATDITGQGTLVGTLQYMAPEQLEARDADTRSDLFSFGAVLYEMLTARKAFAGASQASLIAAILTADPSPLAIAATAPPALDRVIRTCLAKDPDDRWQSAGDLARELKWIAESPQRAESAAAPSAKQRRPLIPWLAAAAAALAAISLAWVHFREPAAAQPSLRFTIPTEARLPAQIRISPDGTKIAFVGQNSQGKLALWFRSLDSLQSRELPGTEGAQTPFWSPDSRQIAYFEPYYKGHLMRIDTTGGQPQIICEAAGGLGGDWSADDIILFASERSSTGSGIRRVSARGGVPVQITQPPDMAIGGHGWPDFFPDGKHYIYSEWENAFRSGRKVTRHIYLASLDSKEARPLVESNFSARIAPGSPPQLLFVSDGALMAQEIDVSNYKLKGEPVRVADQVGTDIPYNAADFSVSKNGVLAINAAAFQHEIAWLDRAGHRAGPGTPATKYGHPTLSPDGRFAIFELDDARTMTESLRKIDIERGETTLFAGMGSLAVYYRDGTAVAFLCQTSDKPAFCRKTPGGAGESQMLWDSGTSTSLNDFSPDGRFLSFTDTVHGRGIWILPLTGDRKPYRFYPTEFTQRHGEFSPDGKWMSYSSNESGDAFEVYVQPFPPTGEKWKVSTQGGAQARWRRDGKEMYYRTFDGRMMAVDVKTGHGFEAGTPHLLFQTSPDPLFPNLGFSYDVSADGQHFLINTAADDGHSSPITIITNWTATLKK